VSGSAILFAGGIKPVISTGIACAPRKFATEPMEIISPPPCQNGTNALFQPVGAPACLVRRSYPCRRCQTQCRPSPHKGFIPGVTVWWRPAAFRARLAENLVTASLGTWCENRDLLADDIERSRRGSRCDHECYGHGSPPYIVFGICRMGGRSAHLDQQAILPRPDGPSPRVNMSAAGLMSQ
jgi:hypothetical protein